MVRVVTYDGVKEYVSIAFDFSDSIVFSSGKEGMYGIEKIEKKDILGISKQIKDLTVYELNKIGLELCRFENEWLTLKCVNDDDEVKLYEEDYYPITFIYLNKSIEGESDGTSY